MELLTRMMEEECRETREFSELDLAAVEGTLNDLPPSMFSWLDEDPRERLWNPLRLQANTVCNWGFSG